ncbi:MAG: twin-arginine translocase TatA/TatE family subunit [Armatimonadota bacterium]
MFGLGGQELIIILLIVGLLFGAKRLPELGKSLGEGLREFKKTTRAIVDDDTNKG